MMFLEGDPGPDPETDMTFDEVDAQLILEYIEFKQRGEGIDLGPPESAWQNGMYAHENDDAWMIVADHHIPMPLDEAMKIIKGKAK